MKKIFFIFVSGIAIACTKTELPPEPTCRKVLILSEKYNLAKVYLRTDTTYNDIVCGDELKKFIEAKNYWDSLGGFVVCGLDLYEKRIHIIK